MKTDPIAPMRFLPMYRLGLHYCGGCHGPMSHMYALDSGHLDCIADALASFSDACFSYAKSLSAIGAR